MELDNLILKFIGKIRDKNIQDNFKKEKKLPMKCTQVCIKVYGKAIVIQ